MPDNSDSGWIDGCDASKDGDCQLGVLEHLAHQCVSAEQAIAHLVVVLFPIVRMGCRSGNSRSPIFETDRVWSEHDDAFLGERRPKRLIRISDQSADLALAEVAFAVVLMMNDYSGRRLAQTLWYQQKRGNRVAVSRFVDNALSLESAFFMHVDDGELCSPRWRLEPKPPAYICSKARSVVVL